MVAKVNFGVSVPTTTCTPSRQGPEQRSNTAPATAMCDTLPDDDAGRNDLALLLTYVMQADPRQRDTGHDGQGGDVGTVADA